MRFSWLVPLIALTTACAPLLMKNAPKIPITSQPLSWAEVLDRPLPAGGTVIPYGADTSQYGVLRVPQSAGPHPVVALLHGGCWLNQFDREYFEHWSQWFNAHGYATWNIEYRRLGDTGGGWPGTFADVGLALDYLHQLAKPYQLDLSALRVVGHSAGGHLALWAATRDQLPVDSELASAAPIAIRQVIGLAAIADLETYRIGPAGSCHSSVDALLEGDPQTQPERYQLTSPQRRLPIAADMVLIQGDADTIVSPQSCAAFATEAQAAGSSVRCLLLPGAGHFDTGVPTPASAAAMRDALRQ